MTKVTINIFSDVQAALKSLDSIFSNSTIALNYRRTVKNSTNMGVRAQIHCSLQMSLLGPAQPYNLWDCPQNLLNFMRFLQLIIYGLQLENANMIYFLRS